MIPPGRGELEFHYTDVELSAPEKDRLKYKLDTVDSDWVKDAGSRRAAYYNNVSPGHYTFHAIACNKDGVWNETGGVAGVHFEAALLADLVVSRRWRFSWWSAAPAA